MPSFIHSFIIIIIIIMIIIMAFCYYRLRMPGSLPLTQPGLSPYMSRVLSSVLWVAGGVRFCFETKYRSEGFFLDPIWIKPWIKPEANS